MSQASREYHIGNVLELILQELKDIHELLTAQVAQQQADLALKAKTVFIP